MLVLIILLLLLNFTYSKYGIDPNEYNALHQLYNSCNGSNWKWLPDYPRNGYPWNFVNNTKHNDPCLTLWQGVYCIEKSKVTGQIFSISLINFGLVGQIPPEFTGFSQLLFLTITENNITGPVPVMNGSNLLLYYNLSYNALSGTIPSALSQFSDLNLLYLSNNQLTGPIPSSLSKLHKLQYISLFNNSLSGPIPNLIGQFKDLVSINLGFNKLNDTIPSNLNDLKNLTFLSLNNNQFTGSIPDFSNTKIVKLSLASNRLMGSLPESLFTLKNLSVLSLNDNNFIGTIPKNFGKLNNLRIILLQGNQLSGSLSEVFNPSTQSALMNIDISNNQFNGVLPDQLFQLPSIQTVAAVKNCFHGTLPTAMCNANCLQVLALDGLTSSPSCIDEIWDPLHLFVGYFARRMKGGIPSCVWNMKNLTTLHLSGNLLSGTISRDDSNDYTTSNVSTDQATHSQSMRLNQKLDPSFSSASAGLSINQTSPWTTSLKDLSLSHNILTGTIPTFLQQLSFDNIDLSYNKLKGHVQDMENLKFSYTTVASNTSSGDATVNLQVNRLTGYLPTYFENAYGVNVLLGNIFACSLNHPIPKNDPNQPDYICGSGSLEGSMIEAAALLNIVVCVLGAIFIVAYFFSSQYYQKLMHYIRIVAQMIKYIDGVGIDLLLDKNRLPGGKNFVAKICSFFKFGIYETNYHLVSDMECSEEDHQSWNSTPSLSFMLHYSHLFRFISIISFFRKVLLIVMALSVVVFMPIYASIYSFGPEDWSTHQDTYTWVISNAFITGLSPAALLCTLYVVLLILVTSIIISQYKLYLVPNNLFYSRKNYLVQQLRRCFSYLKGKIQRINSNPKPARGGSDISVDSVPDNISADWHVPLESMGYFSSQGMQSFRMSSSVHTMLLSDIINEGNIHLQEQKHSTNELPVSMRTSFPSYFEYKESSSGLENDEDKDLSNGYNTEGDEDQRQSSTSAIPSNWRLSTFSWKSLDYYTFSRLLLHIVIFLFNDIVCLVVNVAYVTYESSSRPESSIKFVVQISMAAFKLLWNMIVVPIFMTYLPINEMSLKLNILMLIFNNVFAPYIATSFTDSSCLLNLYVIGTEPVSTSYTFQSCQEEYQSIDINTLEIITVCTHSTDFTYETTYTPSYVYYYTCASALLRAYVPVFIYCYSFLAIALPLCVYILCTTHDKYIPSYLLVRIPGIFRPQNRGMINFMTVFRSNIWTAQYTQHLVVLLTFGICCPPFSLILGGSVSLCTYVWQLVIWRYIKYEYLINMNDAAAVEVSAPIDKKLTKDMKKIEIARLYELDTICKDSWKDIKNVVHLVNLCCMLFYFFVLFDMVGDSSNIVNTLWMVLAMIFASLIIRHYTVDMVYCFSSSKIMG